MVPRVLMVGSGCGRPEMEEAEAVVAPDGDAALGLLRRERFDAVILDLGLAPLDGWCVLAAVGTWVERPQLIAIVGCPDHVGRAVVLGADLCMAAGTELHARALSRATADSHKETQCPRSPTSSFRQPMTSGARA